MAVCVLPGTELSFADEVRITRRNPWPDVINYKTAIFRQINRLADVLEVVGPEIRRHQPCDCGRINAPQLRIVKSEVPIGATLVFRFASAILAQFRTPFCGTEEL